MNGIEICTALDGKKYKEDFSMSKDFFQSRHKKSCVQKINGINQMSSYDKRVNGQNINVCRGCGHESNNNCHHFEEDLIEEYKK